MNIQASINQGLSIASMLYTQTDKYKGEQEFKREKRETEVAQREKQIGNMIGVDNPEVDAAAREYALTGRRKAYRKALARQTDEFGLEQGEYSLLDFGVDITGSGSNRELISQIQQTTGYSRGRSAAILRAERRRLEQSNIQDIYESPEYAAALQRVRAGQGGPK
jgi:hypothetical protein